MADMAAEKAARIASLDRTGETGMRLSNHCKDKSSMKWRLDAQSVLYRELESLKQSESI
jgi:hypothetical protein